MKGLPRKTKEEVRKDFEDIMRNTEEDIDAVIIITMSSNEEGREIGRRTVVGTVWHLLGKLGEIGKENYDAEPGELLEATVADASFWEDTVHKVMRKYLLSQVLLHNLASDDEDVDPPDSKDIDEIIEAVTEAYIEVASGDFEDEPDPTANYIR